MSELAIGIDVGGTKVAAGLVDASGAVSARRSMQTAPERGADAVLWDVHAAAEQLTSEASEQGRRVCAIGLAVPELVDPRGRITSAHTVDWRGGSIQAAFASMAPVVVQADVRAAAYSEAWTGAARGHEIAVYVNVGTGISSTLVLGGRPFQGARGGALVLGSGALSARCDHCGAGVEPVLEAIASGPALVARYRERNQEEAVERASEVLERAEAGDPAATEVVETAADALGVSVGFLVNVLDPHVVVVGGGLGLAGGRYWSRFEVSAREHIWSEEARDLPIVPGALGADAGVIGAAGLAIAATGEAAGG